jgi:tRNA (guanine-N7-)-methyltransferase
MISQPSSAMPRRGRQLIDVSSHLIELESSGEPAPIDWKALFANDRPVELEIGSGKGLFLLNAAADRPGHNFLGVELSQKYARLAAERLARHGRDNAKVMSIDARLVIGRLVPAATLHAVHVYFPDPWWKQRHKKRRVFTDALVAGIERALVPGGELRVASDVAEYFMVIRSVMAANPRFHEHELPPAKSPEHALDYLTNFERKYRLEGRPIFRAHYGLDEAACSSRDESTTGQFSDRTAPSPE